MKNNIPKWAKSLKFWALTFAAFVGVWAAAPIVGLDLPRWTWFTEHQALAAEVKQNTIKALKSDVSHIRRQLIDARIAKSKAKPGTPLYSEFFKDEEELKDELKDAKSALARARQEK